MSQKRNILPTVGHLDRFMYFGKTHFYPTLEFVHMRNGSQMEQCGYFAPQVNSSVNSDIINNRC